jgi:cyclic pyranopterin phosphate synthase
MPPNGIFQISHQDILTYEEIYTIVKASAELGIDKVRITGGEPLVRSGVPRLIEMLARIDTITDISLTTNGLLLGRCAAELKAAGLRRVNVSLDTLRPEKFKSITCSDYSPDDVLEGIEAAKSVGVHPVKLNMVVMAGINDNELLDFGAKTIDDGWHVRFIEFMPVTSQGVITSQFLSVNDMKKRLKQLGKLEPCLPSVGNGPVKYFCFPRAKGTVGFITPVSEHFCFNCNRLRLTADGKLRLCLLSEDEIDLKQPLRSGTNPAGLKQLIEKAVGAKPLQHHMAEGHVPQDRPFCQVGG